MSSVEASRPRLEVLVKAAYLAKQAMERAEHAESALRNRENSRRREWGYDGEDDDDDDEDVEWREQVAKDREDHPDEEEVDFYFHAKQKRFENELLQRKRDATEAYRAFVTEFEVCVKKDSLVPITELHGMMQAKLPVELREMVYSFLNIPTGGWNGIATARHTVHVAQKTYDPNFHDESMKIHDEYNDARAIFEYGSHDLIHPGGWLLNPEFVGRGMAREIAEIFFSVNDFAVIVYRLEELLVSDRTGTGLKPFEYIRGRIDIRVPATTCNGESERAWQSTANEVAFLNGLYTQLSQLTRLTQKDRLTVAIRLSTLAPLGIGYQQGERRFYNIMESVRAPIYDLIHTGVNVIVDHTRISILQKRIISEGLLNYFRMSKEAWEAEKQSHGPDWMPSMNFIMREELKDEDEGRRSNAERRLREALERRWGHTRSIDAY